MAEDFALDLVEGELLIRDAESAFPLENPTKVTGTHDTGEGGSGAVTAGAFSSPTISFETEASGFPVFVDATFSAASPATGVIDADGNVVINSALNVALDITVGETNPPVLTGDCHTGPVNLTLESTAPWNPDTKQVTLRDADFSVPALTPTDDCIDVVANGVNDQLAGAGHFIEMTLQGDLVLPTAPACKTLTDIDVTPAGESRLGDQVTFTATVTQDAAYAADPACDEVEDGQIPTGIVEFKAGATVLGTAELDGTGTATFTTAAIPAGTFALTAGYRGAKPFGKSASSAVTHKVATKVAVTADIPDTVVIQGDYAEFDVTLTNTGLGSAIINARPQIALERIEGGQIVLAENVEVEYWNGTAWVPSLDVRQGAMVFAPLSVNTGFPLAVGQEVTRKARLGFGHGSLVPAPASLDVTIEVVEVDPTTGAPAASVPPSANAVGQATGVTRMVEEARRPTETTATLAPHTLRQGQTARLDIFTSGEVEGLNPGGTWTVLLDGKPVLVRADDTSVALGLLSSIPARSVGAVEFPIPDDMGTGARVVTLKYSGDAFFEPSEWSSTVYVLASRGTTYSCDTQLLNADTFYVNMTARANLGSVRPSGGAVNLAQLDITMYADRGNAPTVPGFFADEELIVPAGVDPEVSVQAIAFAFTGGSGTATSVISTNKTMMDDSTRPVDPNPDMIIGFHGETGSVVVEGAPGDVVPITLDSVNVTASFNTGGPLFPIPLDCTPVGEPITLGQVTIAGTTLTVAAPPVTREGDPVTLNAAIAPAGTTGTVEFRDASTTLTVVPVRSDGTATITTTALAAGTHSLTARFNGGLAANSTTSEPVTLNVLPETDCAAFAEEGNGAVVRLVYMELLGRCPDQAGYDHWVARLEGGTSAEVFARTISRTTEAVGRVVDDAYETMLGRAPDAVGRAFWIGRLQASGRYDQLLADLAGSGEFWSLSGSTNAGFVTRVYERLLGRAPEPAGLDYWVGRLDSGTSPKVLVRSLANLDEPLGRLVADAYEEILGRAPATSERGIGIEGLRETGSRSGLYAELIGRPEFEDRAQDFPNPED